VAKKATFPKNVLNLLFAMVAENKDILLENVVKEKGQNVITVKKEVTLQESVLRLEVVEMVKLMEMEKEEDQNVTIVRKEDTLHESVPRLEVGVVVSLHPEEVLLGVVLLGVVLVQAPLVQKWVMAGVTCGTKHVLSVKVLDILQGTAQLNLKLDASSVRALGIWQKNAHLLFMLDLMEKE